MKKAILLKSNRLLYKYSHILKEIIAQRDLYQSESHFWASWTKYAAIVNKLQGNIIKYT